LSTRAFANGAIQKLSMNLSRVNCFIYSKNLTAISELEVPVVENEEALNDSAIAEIMGDIQKKSVNEQIAGVGAWKKRAKIDNMFVARTLKVLYIFLWLFD
jgi:hypothetical protein